MYNRYRESLKQRRDSRNGWSDLFDDMTQEEVHQMFVNTKRAQQPKPAKHGPKAPIGPKKRGVHNNTKSAIKRAQRHPEPSLTSANNVFDKAMPKPTLPPVFPHRPLNLNEDGTTINYKKSHNGPYSQYWLQADAEEMERLFIWHPTSDIILRHTS